MVGGPRSRFALSLMDSGQCRLRSTQSCNWQSTLLTRTFDWGRNVDKVRAEQSAQRPGHGEVENALHVASPKAGAAGFACLCWQAVWEHWGASSATT